MSVFVSAGEASGDRLAALVAPHLSAPLFGMGGAGLRARGVETLIDADDVSVTGIVEVAGRLPTLVSAMRALDRALERRAPSAALLVDYPAFHRLLAARARRHRVPVVWCVAPQVWAWRPGRAPGFARSMSRLAVLFRHEVALWTRLGVPTTWVGHPAAEAPRLPKKKRETRCVGLLPGSRPNVVRAHLGLHAEIAAALVARGIGAAFLVSPALPSRLRAAIALSAARVGASVLACPVSGASSLLGDIDAALVTAGTTSLEVALAGVPFVVAHRVSPLTAVVARRLLQTRAVALPNLLVGRMVAPELLQEDATPDAVFRALIVALDRGAPPSLADELRGLLLPRDGATFGARVAAIVEAAR